jgi:hypothetical protein
MKLEYKILWIEDTPKSIRRDKKKIIAYIEDLGFECYIEDITNFSDFEKNIGYKNTSEYDLLLIDLDLGNQETKDEGNLIIKNIRDESIYSEIIFYSSQYEELKRKLNNHFIEGIFTSSREELKNKVEQIIDVTIKKVQDVNNLRGLIMAEVAELDRIKKSILLKYNSKNKDNIKLKKYIKEDIFKKINEELVDLECIINSDCEHNKIDIEKLLNNFFYDSYKKSRTVFKVKKLDSNCSSIPFIHQEYYDNVIKKRNVLAHESEKIREDGTKYLNYTNGKPLEFTEEHCIQIRKDIRKFKKLLEDIYYGVENK